MSENKKEITEIQGNISLTEPSEVKNVFSTEDELLIKNINSVKSLMTAGILQEDAAKDLIQRITLKTSNSEEQTETIEKKPKEEKTKTGTDIKTNAPEQYREVIDYLANAGMNLKDENLTQISTMLSAIESKSVERYKQEISHNAALNNENESDKKRLTSYAQNGTGEINPSRNFTREEIGSMSREEFDRNEKQIMYQMSRGLIK